MSPSNCFYSRALSYVCTRIPKESLLERGGVDLVTGPDAYRDLPRLLGLVGAAGRGESSGAVNVQVGELAHAGFSGFIFLPRLGVGFACFGGSSCLGSRRRWAGGIKGGWFGLGSPRPGAISCSLCFRVRSRLPDMVFSPKSDERTNCCPRPAPPLLPVPFVASPSRPLFPLRARLPTPSPDFLSPTLTDLDLVGVAGRGGAGGCYSCRRTRRTPTSLPSGW